MTRVEIDHEGPIAPYLQLAAILREQIRSGKIPVGRRIPSQRYLAQEYDLSHNTVNKAIEVLKGEGLVERAPGRGMFVRAVP